MTISIKKCLVPESKYKIKCPHEMDPKFLTVHNTYNDASAEREVNYMINNNNQISYHFAIDDKEVIQALPLDRNGWHCGDGNGPGNRSSIGIEICYSKSGGKQYEKAEKLAIKFIAQLLHERKWGIEKVKKHQDWSGKLCPHRILSEKRWGSFLKSIDAKLGELNKQLESKKSTKAGTKTQQQTDGTFLIKVKVNELWYYDKPDWNSRKNTVKQGEMFTVVDTLAVNGSIMYKLKSGNYITANTQFVEKVK